MARGSKRGHPICSAPWIQGRNPPGGSPMQNPGTDNADTGSYGDGDRRKMRPFMASCGRLDRVTDSLSFIHNHKEGPLPLSGTQNPVKQNMALTL